jgi:hypothetical protein
VAQKLRTRSITAENQFTDAAEIVGYFNVSISGTWVGKVTVQRSFDGGSTWFDVASWTSNAQEYGFEPERVVHYRAGIKTAEFVSGQADVRLSQ